MPRFPSSHDHLGDEREKKTPVAYFSTWASGVGLQRVSVGRAQRRWATIFRVCAGLQDAGETMEVAL